MLDRTLTKIGKIFPIFYRFERKFLFRIIVVNEWWRFSILRRSNYRIEILSYFVAYPRYPRMRRIKKRQVGISLEGKDKRGEKFDGEETS